MIASPVIIALLGLTPLAIGSPLGLEGRQATGGREALLDSIAKVTVQLAKTNATVASFNGGGGIQKSITGLTNVNGDVVALGKVLTATTDLAKKTPTLNVTDSTAVGVSFLALQPNINLLLNNLQGKRAAFDGAASGLLDTRSLIRDSITIQQNTAKDLGASLVAALDPSLLGIAQPINDQIQGNFTAAVSKFKGRSGAIKIPSGLVPTATDLLAKIGPVLSKVPGGGGGGKGGGGNPFNPFGKRQDDMSDMPGMSDMYCCGITQAKIDALGPDQNDLTSIPEPVVAMLQQLGVVPM